ncbi:hypothetical protein [Parapedobacter sp. 10938]|uniref:hypothetical protein n=1 Tax=Parapedobacter flavus TaxID=3110225 RepID=UPI002DB99839|nr:hypothetical protein [Parapedobacter sp. 10938]MEC3881127.1 hypothetical protein [Parapedobacter sp. 10938]
MKKSLGFPWVALGALLAIAGCMRNDDEPEYPKRPIARLYVSIEDYQYDASKDDIANVVLIDPADTSEMYLALNHDSEAVGGAGIHFNPFASRLFQAGYNDTTIRIMTVGMLGNLGNSGRIGNGLLKQMRGIAYHQPTELLYVASANTIYGFHQPMNRNGFTDPDRVLRLGAEMRPWSVLLWNDSLLVSNSGNNGGVALYGNLSQIDSLAPDFQALSNIRIEGANAIRGIAFVDSLDLLVAADYGVVQGETRSATGKVYIIEGIKAHLDKPSSTVSPTRTISGALTGLTGPVDVAIDPRGGTSRRTIFVADRDGHTISRFPLSADGNVAPEGTVSLDVPANDRRPFGIYFDVRGDAVTQ